jgi:hypothetical protein
MKQKYILLILLVIILSATSISVLAVTPNLELTPPTQSVGIANQATVNILVEEVTDLRGASITLNFDPAQLQYASSADGGFVPGAFLPAPTVDNINGSVTLDLVSLSSYASGTGTIMSVTFDTIGAGNSIVSFGTTILRDKDNNEIIHTKGSGCLISINVPHIELMPELQGVYHGSQVTVSVEVKDIVNLKGASITLNFEPAQLQYASSADGGFLPGATLMPPAVDNTGGSVVLDIVSLNSYASGTGTVVTVTFDTIGAGNSIVSFGTTILRDNDDNEIVHTSGNGSIITIDPPSLNFSPASQSIFQGDQATIYVEVENATDLKGANITLNFEPAQLQYASSADGGFLPGATLMPSAIDNTGGSVVLSIVSLTSHASGEGTLFSVVFNRSDTAATNICFGATNLRDKNNIIIYHNTGNCSTITSLDGDFNGDCAVDFDDLMIFAMAYGATLSDENWNLVCDIAPDGVIDFDDLMIFAMHYGQTCADL